MWIGQKHLGSPLLIPGGKKFFDKNFSGNLWKLKLWDGICPKKPITMGFLGVALWDKKWEKSAANCRRLPLFWYRIVLSEEVGGRQAHFFHGMRILGAKGEKDLWLDKKRGDDSKWEEGFGGGSEPRQDHILGRSGNGKPPHFFNTHGSRGDGYPRRTQTAIAVWQRRDERRHKRPFFCKVNLSVK